MKRTNTEPSTAFVCWQREAASACLRIELSSEEMHLLPYSHLVAAQFIRAAEGEESLRLTFSTHEVKIEGQELRDLLLGIQDFAIKWLRPVPQRYSVIAPTMGGVIAKISVLAVE